MKAPTRSDRDAAPPPTLVDVRDRAALEAWLRTKPREVSVAFAARAALRVLPFMAVGRHGANGRDVASFILLSVFRACYVASIAAKNFADGTKSVARAVDAARYVQDAAARGVAAQNISAQDVVARAAKAQVAVIAAAADAARAARPAYPQAHAAAAARAAAAAGSAAAAVDEADAYGAASSTLIDAMIADIFVLQEGVPPVELIGAPLWRKMPAEYAEEWSALRRRLLAREDEHWAVWIDWYEARLAGRPSNERLDTARTIIADGVWDQGPAVVNAEIEQLILELEPPPEPAPELGPVVALTQEGIAIVRRPIDGALEDSLQRRLHAGLQRLLPKLTEQTHKVSNEHRELHAVVSEYAELAEKPFDQLDVASLWMVGSGVIAFNEAFGQLQNSIMASPLEPECRALLRQLAEIHGAFILGFPAGRLLADRAARSRLSLEIADQIAPAAGALLGRLRKAANLVEERTRQYFGAIDDARIALGWDAGSVAYAAFATTKNTLIVIGRALIVANSALATVAGAPVLNELDPGQIYTGAVVAFALSELNNIMIFAAAFPELRVWFESIALTLETLKQYHLTKR